MAEKEINIVIESPWKKIIIVGIVIIAFVIVTELFSRYFENLLPNIYTSPYFLYAIIILAVILAGVFLFIFFKRKKKSETANNKKIKLIEITDKEIKKVLMNIDSLLEKIPENEINKFAKSEDAKLYNAMLRKYGVK